MTPMTEAHKRAIRKGMRRSPNRAGRPKLPVVHGTMDGYNNHACRCPDCREAWRVYRKEWRERRKGGAA
jgi:hypothetical protein